MTDLFHQRVIAVVGVAKNCGKTTTLDYMLGCANQAGRTVGLVSVGIDGEASDALLGTPKPSVVVRVGQLVATTRLALDESTASVEYLEDLGFTTPFGEAVVARVLDGGTMVLAGMRHRADVERAVSAMLRAGADQVLVDGAYGRVVGAHPDLADAVVVSTGAIVAPDVDVIADRTRHLVARLSLPLVEAPWQRALLERAVADGRAYLGGSALDEPISLPARSALLGLSAAHDAWTDEVEAIAIPGLVSDAVAHELFRVTPSRTLLVPTGTAIQTSDRASERLRDEWRVRALRAPPVIAIAYNPTSIRGDEVSPEALARAIAARCPNIPVFDPFVGLQ